MRRDLVFLLLCMLAMSARAQGPAPDGIEQFSSERFQVLEGQVQSLKRDILGFSRDLHSLMKEALFQSETQVAVYVSADQSAEFQVSSIQLALDGRTIATRVYTVSENEALRQGGVQRLFVGRVEPGNHKLTVSFLVSESDGRSRRGDTSFNFKKDETANILEIEITGGPSKNEPDLNLKEWRSS